MAQLRRTHGGERHETDPLEGLFCSLSQRLVSQRRPKKSPGATACANGAQNRVLKNGVLHRQRGNLERAPQPRSCAQTHGFRRHVLPQQMHAPGIRRKATADLRDQGRLARSVRPDDGVDLTGQ